MLHPKGMQVWKQAFLCKNDENRLKKTAMQKLIEFRSNL